MQGTKPDDDSAIRALLERWAAAVHARDMKTILEDHSDDIVMFDVPEPLESRGIDAYRGTWDLFFQYSRGGENAFNIISADVTAGESVAWCNCILGIEETRLRLTVGLRKENGRWIVAHEHHSYPLKSD